MSFVDLHKRVGPKLIPFLVAPVLVSSLPLCSDTVAAADGYVDVPKDHWASSAVERVSKADLLTGDGDYFQGNRNVTRYELAAVISRLLDRLDKSAIEHDAVLKDFKEKLTNDLADLKQRDDRFDVKQKSTDKELASYSVKVTSVASETRTNADEIGIMRGKVNTQEAYLSEVDKLRSEVNVLNDKVAKQDKINRITWIVMAIGVIFMLTSKGNA